MRYHSRRTGTRAIGSALSMPGSSCEQTASMQGQLASTGTPGRRGHVLSLGEHLGPLQALGSGRPLATVPRPLLPRGCGRLKQRLRLAASLAPGSERFPRGRQVRCRAKGCPAQGQGLPFEQHHRRRRRHPLRRLLPPSAACASLNYLAQLLRSPTNIGDLRYPVPLTTGASHYPHHGAERGGGVRGGRRRQGLDGAQQPNVYRWSTTARR